MNDDPLALAEELCKKASLAPTTRILAKRLVAAIQREREAAERENERLDGLLIASEANAKANISYLLSERDKAVAARTESEEGGALLSVEIERLTGVIEEQEALKDAAMWVVKNTAEWRDTPTWAGPEFDAMLGAIDDLQESIEKGAR